MFSATPPPAHLPEGPEGVSADCVVSTEPKLICALFCFSISLPDNQRWFHELRIYSMHGWKQFKVWLLFFFYFYFITAGLACAETVKVRGLNEVSRRHNDACLGSGKRTHLLKNGGNTELWLTCWWMPSL